MYDYDEDQITKAAQSVAIQLSLNGYGEVIIEPGDATGYRIIVLPCGRRTVSAAEGVEVLSRNYMVCLATGFGGCYQWTGHAMHADYCAKKWAVGGHGSTGEVMARFLTALSPLVPRVTS